MIPYERRKAILERLQSAEVSFIDDLVEALGVSSSTIRRDVNALAKAGEVIALRGGGIRINENPVELPTTAKTQLNSGAKQRIARAAADLVADGETIYLDSGTTTLRMYPYLRSRDVRIVTTNTQVLALAGGQRCSVSVIGGDYLPSIGSIAGSITEEMMGHMFFDKAFLGASGVSERAGVSTFDVREAAKKRIACAHSKETYVLADHSKLGRVTFYKALDLKDCHLVVDRHDELLLLARGHVVADAADVADGEDPGVESGE